MSEAECRRRAEGPKRNRTWSLNNEDVHMTLEEHKTSEGRRKERKYLPVFDRFVERGQNARKKVRVEPFLQRESKGGL
jgi:hypothetical protein